MSAGETESVCKFGGPYASFAQRLIMLSSDVEMNPGPTNDVSHENTERILAAISKTSEEIKEVKCAVQSVQQEIYNVSTLISTESCHVPVELIINEIPVKSNLSKYNQQKESVKLDHNNANDYLACLTDFVSLKSDVHLHVFNHL